MTCSEEWRPVKGFPRYEVSNLGRVRSLAYIDRSGHQRNGFEVKTRFTREGGALVSLTSEDGKKHGVSLGRVVLEAFVRPLAADEIALHGSAGRNVTTLDNLSIGTYAQNNGPDRIRDGTHYGGCDHHKTQLTERQVLEIRSLRGLESQSSIAKRYGLTQSTVSKIQLSQTFARVK